MNTKTISMCQGKGSLSHNNREFSAKNIDSSRTADNIVLFSRIWAKPTISFSAQR